MESNIIEVSQGNIIEAINRSEVDLQISTAKRYPRELGTVLNKISTLSTLDTDTASSCFYALRRGGANGNSLIEGLSVRFAEIVANSWGNLRIQTRIIGNDGKTITAQGICQDLESNVAVSLEVKRRITDKNGRTFSEDMQVTTGNAASSIAYRNAVLKIVPGAVLKKIISEVKQVAMGQALDLESSRQNMIAYFAKLGVTEEMLLEYLGVRKREEIDKEAVFELRGTANAIKDGTTTVQESFIKPLEQKRAAEEAKKKAEETKAKAAEAIKRSQSVMSLPAEEEKAPEKAEAVKKGANGDIKPNDLFDKQ